MVRVLFQPLDCPYAQYACCDISGHHLMDPVWEAVSQLERKGFKVMALTCDGASANCRLWKIHSQGKSNGDVLYKVPNIFASDGRYLYFISDPPHLLKTVGQTIRGIFT